MKELTIEHLAAYLPYGVSAMKRDFFPPHEYVKKELTGLSIFNLSKDEKIFLRPLSQLTETIDHNGEMFVPIDRLCAKFGNGFDYTMMQGKYDALEFPYMVITYLHSIHVDTFGLIEAGLAIPIPSIEQP